MENTTQQAAQTGETKIEQKPATPEGFISEAQLLKKIPISRRTCFSWVQTGKLPVVKIGRRKIYHYPSVEAALLRLQRNGFVE
jgi:hypothetical protein